MTHQTDTERSVLGALIAKARAITTRRETITLDEHGASKALELLAESSEALRAFIDEVERRGAEISTAHDAGFKAGIKAAADLVAAGAPNLAGADYGMASEDDRRAMRDHFRDRLTLADRIAAIPTPPTTREPSPLAGEVMSAAARDVLAERRRQIETEGYTTEHDDTHDKGELAGAAAAYAAYRSQVSPEVIMGETIIEMFWPWAPEDWKPKTRRDDLVRAAALLFAEIERYDRVYGDDASICFICGEPLKEGDAYFWDVSGSFVHADCCGPEVESYVDADETPLKPGDPIPEPSIWHEADFAPRPATPKPEA